VEAANKGGVGGEGTIGRLLAMAREMGGSLVRQGDAQRTAALGRLDRGRETRAGRTSAGEERGKLGGLAEGH
jgi:hypothetical protein